MPPKTSPKKGSKPGIGINPDTGTTSFGGQTTKPAPRPDPASGSSSFDSPLNNRSPKPSPKPASPPMLGKTGQWIDKTFGPGDKSTAPKAGPPTPNKANNAAAAKAVVSAVKNLDNIVGSGLKTLGIKPKKASAPAPAQSPSTPTSPPSSSSTTPRAPGAKPKPGNVYAKTRAAWKAESKKPGDKSSFDMGMSGADVKKYRKQFLKDHPAAAKAVAKGTLSMGDINMTVRRLKKKNPGAIGIKSEDG